jgi:hypothetical protein
MLGTVQAFFNTLEIGWKLNSIQHEDDTGYDHYEWVWEFVQRPEGV